MGVHRGNADNTFYLCTNGKFMVLSMLIFPCNLLYSIRIDFTSQEYLENKKRAKPLRSAYIAQCALFTPAALVELMGYIVIIDLWYPRKKMLRSHERSVRPLTNPCVQIQAQG